MQLKSNLLHHTHLLLSKGIKVWSENDIDNKWHTLRISNTEGKSIWFIKFYIIHELIQVLESPVKWNLYSFFLWLSKVIQMKQMSCISYYILLRMMIVDQFWLSWILINFPAWRTKILNCDHYGWLHNFEKDHSK